MMPFAGRMSMRRSSLSVAAHRDLPLAACVTSPSFDVYILNQWTASAITCLARLLVHRCVRYSMTLQILSGGAGLLEFRSRFTDGGSRHDGSSRRKIPFPLANHLLFGALGV